MSTPANLSPLRTEQDLTLQEHEFLLGGMDQEVARVHTPLGLVQGTVSNAEMQKRRGVERYVDNPMTLMGWKFAKGFEGSVIRLVLAPINPETGESTADPRVLIGDKDPETGAFQERSDVTAKFVQDRIENDGIDLHMRPEGGRSPEGKMGHGGPEQG